MPVRATKRGQERTPLDGAYDVLICGASFAGLAVARELAGSGAEVLVVDRYEIGERQTSACGIPTEWLRQLGLMAAERQRFDSLVMHTPHGDARYRLPWTFSTFDYRELCELLWRDCDARFETAKVNGRGAARRAATARSGSRPTAAPSPRGSSSTRSAGGGCWRRATATSRPTRRSPAGWRCTPRGAARTWRSGSTAATCRRATAGRFPAARRAADRDRLLRPALPRQGHDRHAHRGPGQGAERVPGQLDPPQAAPGDRGRRLLRRRLGRALPAAQRRGDQDRALLRDRARPRAARRRRGAAEPRGGRGPLRRVQRLPRVEVPLDAVGPAADPPRPPAPARAADPPDVVQAFRRVVLRPLPADRAPGVRRLTRRPRPARPATGPRDHLASSQSLPMPTSTSSGGSSS